MVVMAGADWLLSPPARAAAVLGTYSNFSDREVLVDRVRLRAGGKLVDSGCDGSQSKSHLVVRW